MLVEHIAFAVRGPQKGTKIQLVMLELQTKASAWNVRLDEVKEASTSLIGYGVRAGERVVLKLTKHGSDEARSGEVLKAFGGDGAVRVLEFETGAVLLERLEPGEQLANLAKRDDDEATRILAQVLERLAHHQPPAVCPTVADWGRGFDRYLESGDQRLARELVREARELYLELSATQGTPMLLHGDLQHYNVLLDRNRGWIAIDPKGVVGELECEVGALLRNPVELPELFANAATIKRRLEIVTIELKLDYSRALHWSYAQAVLSAIWDIEDGFEITPNNPSLLLARTIKSLL
jgi:streptomycin 6-kinase